MHSFYKSKKKFFFFLTLIYIFFFWLVLSEMVNFVLYASSLFYLATTNEANLLHTVYKNGELSMHSKLEGSACRPPFPTSHSGFQEGLEQGVDLKFIINGFVLSSFLENLYKYLGFAEDSLSSLPLDLSSNKDYSVKIFSNGYFYEGYRSFISCDRVSSYLGSFHYTFPSATYFEEHPDQQNDCCCTTPLELTEGQHMVLAMNPEAKEGQNTLTIFQKKQSVPIDPEIYQSKINKLSEAISIELNKTE